MKELQRPIESETRGVQVKPEVWYDWCEKPEVSPQTPTFVRVWKVKVYLFPILCWCYAQFSLSPLPAGSLRSVFDLQFWHLPFNMFLEFLLFCLFLVRAADQEDEEEQEHALRPVSAAALLLCPYLFDCSRLVMVFEIYNAYLTFYGLGPSAGWNSSGWKLSLEVHALVPFRSYLCLICRNSGHWPICCGRMPVWRPTLRERTWYHCRVPLQGAIVAH